MDKLIKLKSQLDKNITKAKSQLDHIWANVPRSECKFGVIETYLSIFHKLIYIAFKLPNTLPMLIRNHLYFHF
jgi:hypothetical protein